MPDTDNTPVVIEPQGPPPKIITIKEKGGRLRVKLERLLTFKKAAYRRVFKRYFAAKRKNARRRLTGCGVGWRKPPEKPGRISGWQRPGGSCTRPTWHWSGSTSTRQNRKRMKKIRRKRKK